MAKTYYCKWCGRVSKQGNVCWICKEKLPFVRTLLRMKPPEKEKSIQEKGEQKNA